MYEHQKVVEALEFAMYVMAGEGLGPDDKDSCIKECQSVLSDLTKGGEVKRPTFAQALETLINQYNEEKASNTADFILAGYLVNQLSAFNQAVNTREQFYGRGIPDWEPVTAVADLIESIRDLDDTTAEGKLLMAALAKLTTGEYSNKQPDEVVKELDKLQKQMYKVINVPAIVPGLTFTVEGMKGAICTVVSAEETTNLLCVDI